MHNHIIILFIVFSGIILQKRGGCRVDSIFFKMCEKDDMDTGEMRYTSEIINFLILKIARRFKHLGVFLPVAISGPTKMTILLFIY